MIKLPDGDELLTAKEAAELMGVHLYTLYAWARENRGPLRPFRMRPRPILWRKSDVLKNKGRKVVTMPAHKLSQQHPGEGWIDTNEVANIFGVKPNTITVWQKRRIIYIRYFLLGSKKWYSEKEAIKEFERVNKL